MNTIIDRDIIFGTTIGNVSLYRKYICITKVREQ